MRKQALLGLLGLLGLCTSAMAAAVAVDDRPVGAEKPASRSTMDEADSIEETPVLTEEPGVPSDVTPVLLDPNIVFNHVIVRSDGTVTQGAADDDGGVAGPGEHLIYENTLGINTVNFPTNQPVSDDISTIAPDGCNLTRYKFKVLGKVLPGGASGPYTVTYGLYTNCPLAVGSTNAVRDLVRIPGTEGVVTFQNDSPQTIEHIVDFLTPVALPNNVYLSIRFNRSNCGTVIGAPAMTGFSGDIWDFPGFPCNGFLGGFPQLPHASFWLQMYGSTSCTPAFSAYKCQRPSGGQALIGANVQGVDDIKLIVNNCHMVGYEVVVKGVGFYTFDLRRDCDGSVVPGTERTFQVNASTTPLLQVARFTFDPPIILTTDRFFLGFKCTSNSSGIIVAGIQPIIGESSEDYFTVGLEGCAPVLPISGVHGAVNLAITCSGAQPIGACCDPHMTECNAGPDVGKRCACNSTCQGGGANDGICCTSNSECTAPGTCTPVCAAPGSCESVCRQTTEINCPFPPRGQEQRPHWQIGDACIPDPFGNNPCGVAACCHLKPNPDNPNILDEVCDNMTKNQCNAAVPTDKARLWQLGEYCGLNAQVCPRNACLARDGSCYIAHNTAGCSDPFCCSDICAIPGPAAAFCCNTAWDATCVTFAEQYCPQAPPNDQCAPDFPVRGFEGALAIPVPGSKSTSNLKATESILDSGFCCNTGTGVCVGEPDAGAPCIVNTDCQSGQCSERTDDPGAPALGTIWFKFVQGAGTSAGISTCTSNAPALDSVLQVFEANDNTTQRTACDSLTVIGCNDDTVNCGSSNRNSRVCLRNLTPGKTYYIMLGAKTDTRRGNYTVTISTSCAGGSPASDPVPNDYCRNATAITDLTPNDPLVVPFAIGRFCLSGPGAGRPCTSDTDCRVCSGGGNAGQPCTSTSNCPNGTCPTPAAGTCPSAGPTFECPPASCSPGAREDVWFNYTATCTGEAAFSTCGSGNPNTNIAVYEGCTTCPTISDNTGFMTNGCNADASIQGCIEPGRVVVNVVQGLCYKVRISNQDGFDVAGNLTITCNTGDCNNNGILDVTDLANCPALDNSCKDCNGNGRLDFCDIRDGIEQDCQPNGRPDSCDISLGVSTDCQPNGIPDSCDGGTGGNCTQCTGIAGPKCTIDSRRPFPPNAPGTPSTDAFVKMDFANGCNVAGAVPGDFTVACNPVGAPCPSITTVNVVGQLVTVNLSTPIPAGKWTCVTHTATNAQVCAGSLPADCNADRTASPADVIKLVDHLNGVAVPPLTIDHCDMDRSGVCAPADIVTLIDLLNGANSFGVWNAKTLAVCPAP